MIAGASHVSLSALSSFKRTAGKYSINMILLKPNDRHRESFVVNNEGPENDDNDELGVEVNHLSCTMYVSGVIDEKG